MVQSVSSWRPARSLSKWSHAHELILPRQFLTNPRGLCYPPHSPDLALADLPPLPKVKTAIKWRQFQDRPKHQVRSRLTKCSFFRFLRWLMRIFMYWHSSGLQVNHYNKYDKQLTLKTTKKYFLCIYSHNINLGTPLQHLSTGCFRQGWATVLYRRLMLLCVAVSHGIERWHQWIMNWKGDKVGTGGSIPGSSKGLYLPQYPNRLNSLASFLSNG